jgi:hypothetical protein
VTAKAKQPGIRRAAFRAKVEHELAQMGFRANVWTWRHKTGGLLVVVNNTLRELPIHAGCSREKVAYHLGRAAGWAEMMRAA